jgi:hypothetical protein
MSSGLEARWVQLLDSGRWRRLLGSTTGSRVQSSPAFRSVDLARRSAVTRYQAWRDRDRFSDVETLVVFIGHVKSGGSLIGAMIDAHPDALVSDEVDLLRYLQAGFRREQLFQLVARGSRREAMKGRVTARRLDPYSLAVAGASQGLATRPRVLGDVRSGPTTRRLGERLEMLAELDEVMAPTETRYLHVVRNPFDPISAMVRRGQRTFANAIQDYTDQCERLVRIRGVLPPERLLTVRYESFTHDPVAQLAAVCAFLDLTATTELLASCAEVIQPDRPGERTSLDWSPESISSVQHVIDSVPFLDGYTWE